MNDYVKNFDDFIKESKTMEVSFESLDLQVADGAKAAFDSAKKLAGDAKDKAFKNMQTLICGEYGKDTITKWLDDIYANQDALDKVKDGDVDSIFDIHENYKTITESVANEDDKASIQIGYLQYLVNGEMYRLIEKEHKYTNAQDLMNAIEKFAKEKYKEVVTEKGAMSYEKWWKNFSSKENIAVLDRIIKWRS